MTTFIEPSAKLPPALFEEVEQKGPHVLSFLSLFFFFLEMKALVVWCPVTPHPVNYNQTIPLRGLPEPDVCCVYVKYANRLARGPLPLKPAFLSVRSTGTSGRPLPLG